MKAEKITCEECGRLVGVRRGSMVEVQRRGEMVAVLTDGFIHCSGCRATVTVRRRDVFEVEAAVPSWERDG